MRAFHHGAILHNTKSGVRTPKDLEGRRVGVNRGYTVTTGVWARSILQHEYGVDLDAVTWVLSGDEHVAEFRPPPNVVPMEAGKTMEGLLASGEIAAAIGVQIESPEVKPLIPNAKEVGFDALRRTGHYPINHTVVVRDDVLAANPGLADDLFDAFVEAKQRYVDRLTRGEIADPDPVHVRVMKIIGDPLPYGIEPNRQMIESLVEYAVEDAPQIPDDWETDQVPLSSLVRGSGATPTRLVLFRRPIEHRAETRADLEALVLTVVVEQVAELLGIDPEQVDPRYEGEP